MQIGSGSGWGNVATRDDHQLRVQEKVGFFGCDDRLLFGCLHLPQAARTEAVLVMCPSILNDMTANYPREVALARMLASRGVAVQRFQYRSMGNSYGDPLSLTFDDLVSDTRLAAEVVCSTVPNAALAFLGARWGALVAASTAAHLAAPLVLWEPVLDSRTYFREAFRAQAIRAMTDSRASQGSVVDLERALMSDGWVDILGSCLARALYTSSRRRRLFEMLGHNAARMLLIQAETGGEFEAALGGSGASCEVARLGTPETWWFSPQLKSDHVEEMASRIVAWLNASRLP